jgi:AraC-like DNA-binding protein
MTWADVGPGHLALGPVGVDVYHWAEFAGTVANPPHRHTHFEVCWVEDGVGRFVVDGRAHPVGPGSLLFARPGVRHQIIGDRPPGLRLAWVAFHLRVPAAEGELAALFTAFVEAGRALAHDADGRIATLWAALRSTGGGPPLPGRDAATASVARALLVALAQSGTETLWSRPPGALAQLGAEALRSRPPGALAECGAEALRSRPPGALAECGAETPRSRPPGALAERGAEPPWSRPPGAQNAARTVRQALRYVHDNLDRPLAVDELARHVHLSRRQLTRLFTDRVGRSPAAYVEHTRLDHAAALLVRTDLPIKRVAAAVGYPDPALFTRAFSRRLGTPPGRFRRSADLQKVLAGSLSC